MPAKSRAFQRLAGAAEHGADFPMARKLRSSMTHQQLHDFASGSMRGKPEHTTPSTPVKRNSAPASDLPHPHRNLGRYLHQSKGR